MVEELQAPQERPDPRADALAVVRTLCDAGHTAYFAGGCVRDLLLGLPAKDYDVATDAPPARVRQLFRNTQAVGQAFGVILVRVGRSVIEVATFRTDGSYGDGRRPDSVTFSTPEEDAKRRDFTINGMFLDPVEERVIDFVDGQADVSAKLIRAIGVPDERFAEDHLRLLRAVRFASRLGFEIEPATAAAVRGHATQLPRISPERIADELRKMLTAATRPAAWRMLWDLQLIPELLRHLPERATTPPNIQTALLPNVAPGEAISFGLALAALAVCYRTASTNAPAVLSMFEKAEIGRVVRALRTGLKISNDEADVIEGSLALSKLLQPAEPSVATMKRFLATPTSADARRLLAALPARFPELRPRIDWLAVQFSAFDNVDVAPTPFITGDDLTAFGATPGPLFKKVLNAVYDAQLEGGLADRDHAVSMARGLLGL